MRRLRKPSMHRHPTVFLAEKNEKRGRGARPQAMIRSLLVVAGEPEQMTMQMLEGAFCEDEVPPEQDRIDIGSPGGKHVNVRDVAACQLEVVGIILGYDEGVVPPALVKDALEKRGLVVFNL